MNKLISKSSFIKYARCPRLYYLNLHFPELATTNEYQQLLAKEGTKVGILAQNYFGNCYVIQYDSDKMKMVVETQKALADPNIENIAEASFIYEDCYCAVDLLHKVNGGYEIYEVKSVVEPSDIYYLDVSFQKYILEKVGLTIINYYVLGINNEYVRQDELDLQALFVKNETNGLFDDYNFKDTIEQIRALKTLPSFIPSKECKECNYHKHCFQDLPINNVFTISGLRKQHEYYNKGLITFEDILPYLKGNQFIQVNSELDGVDPSPKKDKLKTILNKLAYPLYFLDFETVAPCIPPYKNARPNQRIIIQYSLHYQIAENTPLLHTEYLANDTGDLREVVAKRLVEDLGKTGSIIVYHKSFEGGAIKELARDIPKYQNELSDIYDRLFDLEEPFTTKAVYNRKMKGKTSIKYVLPALCPDFETAYHDLANVHNGTEAMAAYEKMLTLQGDERLSLRHDMLEYCKLDTLAMVEILKVLKGIINDE